MSRLAAEIEATLQPGMMLPEPIGQLFEWIESNGFFVDSERGTRVGLLYRDSEIRAGWSKTERPGGTLVEFSAEGNTHLHHWFGHSNAEVLSKLCVFARTGGEGSMAAFWLAPDGAQRIVHLGSGSGSTLVCVLADDPVDFLRLLAIGYDEICWDSQFDAPPNATTDGLFVHPNVPFQAWVSSTFGVPIPRTAREILKSAVTNDEPPDPFLRWVEENT